MSRNNLVMLALLVVPLLGAADPSTDRLSRHAATPQRIAELVAQLGAPVRMDRDLAAGELAGLGAAALPALEGALNNPDAEIRRRAGELVEQLRAEIACATTLLDLDWKTIPVRLAIEDLARKTGLPFQLNVPGGAGQASYSRWVTLEGEDVPLLKALDHVCRVGSLQVRWPPQPDMPIVLMPGPAAEYPASYDGPFSVRLRELELTRRHRFGEDRERTSRLEIRFEVLAEPHVTLLATQPLVLTEAVDAHGSLLNLESARSVNQYNRPPVWGIRSPLGGRVFNVKASMPLPQEPGQVLQRLAGEVTVDLLTGRDLALVIDDVAQDAAREHDIDGTSLVVEAVEETDEQLAISLVVDQTRTAAGVRSGAFFRDCFELVDKNGEKLSTNLTAQPNTRIRGSGATTKVNLTAGLSEQTEGPWRLLVYQARQYSYTIPFRFDDIPLP